MKQTARGAPVKLRPLAASDSDFLFSWANDEAVIRGSFMRSAAITREQHDAWFKDKLVNPTCFLFIIENLEGAPVGQIRFDLVEGKPREAFLAIGIAPEFRKLGYATEAIRTGTERMFSDTDVVTVHACIRPENIGSKRAFDSAGYEDCGMMIYEDRDALYVRKIKDV